MIYLASLVEETRDKVDGYKFIHTKAELDEVVVDNLSSNRVVIRGDFAQEYFTPTGLVNYIENVHKINANIIIELDNVDDVLTRDKFIDKLSACRNVDEIIMLLGGHSKEFMDTLRFLIDRVNSDYTKMLEYSNQVSRLQMVIENLKSELT